MPEPTATVAPEPEPTATPEPTEPEDEEGIPLWAIALLILAVLALGGGAIYAIRMRS